ncbi:MAG TPA: hypothetical protein PLJ71_14965 [Candidatus Hydrogenedentes bacterium]|nr:hypothetical protein [Candidatus Hydrogenedentota bacterium]HQM49988.1 hypothetical protein [Candidatus Hydrogenedentota bacterium]
MRCSAARVLLLALFPAIIAAGEPAGVSNPPEGEWFVPARLNYGTWAQQPQEDFPDGNMDARMEPMERIGMRDYFFMRGEEAFYRQIYAAAQKHGIRLWLRTFAQARYSEEDVKAHPERLFQMDWTKAQGISCPSWPENQVEWVTWTEPFLLEFREYLHGVNLDFIRYPDDSPCSCAACHALYEKWLGRHEVTEEDLEDHELAKKYADMRNSVIGGMVQRVRAMCDRAGLKFSVCVFANLDHARMLGQDWPRWAREGLVDVVCPMSYTSDRAQHQKWIRDHVTAIAGEAELWDSVAREWDPGENTPEEVLIQSLDVLRGGAHGLASFNMAAFSEDDWRLQADLQKEYGWSISIRDQTLYVNGPPFAWMKLPAWSLPHCAVSGGQLTPQAEDDRLVVRDKRVWMEGPDAFPAVYPGRLVESELILHNWSLEDAEIQVDGKLPEGWRIEKPAGSLPLGVNDSLTVAVAVRTPESVPPGRYWLDIMAEDTRAGEPVARAIDVAELKLDDGVAFTILPLTRTRFTSSPTWVPVDVAVNSASATGY